MPEMCHLPDLPSQTLWRPPTDLITAEPIPHSVIDFTLALRIPETEDGYNAAITMTDKFRKALLGNYQELVKDYEEFHRPIRQYYQPRRGGDVAMHLNCK